MGFERVLCAVNKNQPQVHPGRQDAYLYNLSDKQVSLYGSVRTLTILGIQYVSIIIIVTQVYCTKQALSCTHHQYHAYLIIRQL